MKKDIIAVSKKNHKNYYFYSLVNQNSDFSQYKNLPNCPIFFDEIKYVASCYPIFFLKNNKNSFNLECIFSLLKNLNLFINNKNQWTGSYIPAFFRFQPFFLAKTNAQTDKILCFYLNNPSIKKKATPEHFPFMDEKGNTSQALNKILSILIATEKSREKSKNAIDCLNEFDLLKEWKITIKANDAEKEIQGLFQIDEEKLKSLKSQSLHKLHINGALEIAYAQLISATQLNTLVSLHLKKGNFEKESMNLREQTLQKQKQEKKKELDLLVENLFDQD